MITKVVIAPVIHVGSGSITVIDNLNSDSAADALSASQGKVLKGMIDSIEPGTGDMTKAIYDTNDNGVVDNSEKLSGNTPAYFLDRNNHTGAQDAATITEDATHRFVSDAEKITWNAKQNALGFTPVSDTELTTGLGTKVDKVAGKGLSANDYTTTEKNKLAGLSNYDDSALQTAVSELQQDPTTKTYVDTGLADKADKADVQPKKILGAVYNKSSWVDLSDFAVNTLGATVVGDKISIPDAGVVDFSKSLQLAQFSCVNHWKIVIEFQLTVPPGATTTGISVGIQSTNANSKNSWANYFRMSTSDNTGRMQFFGQSNNGNWTTISNAATNLSFAQNDLIRLSLERSNEKIFLRAENLTNPVTPVEFATTAPFSTNPISPNTGHFAIFGQGGACTISRITVLNKEIVGPTTLFLGDSKTFGYGSSSLKTTYPGILGAMYSDVCISAGFGDKTQEILNRMDELLALKPKTVVLSIGSNDLRFGIADATFKANYQSIVNQFTAIGARVIHLSPAYEEVLDLTDQYNWVKANFAPFIDVFYIIKQAGNLYSDKIHWSVTGNKWVANAIVDSNLLEGRNTTTDYL